MLLLPAAALSSAAALRESTCRADSSAAPLHCEAPAVPPAGPGAVPPRAGKEWRLYSSHSPVLWRERWRGPEDVSCLPDSLEEGDRA